MKRTKAYIVDNTALFFLSGNFEPQDAKKIAKISTKPMLTRQNALELLGEQLLSFLEGNGILKPIIIVMQDEEIEFYKDTMEVEHA